jgi:predicted adenine nucleotide alpha hydrolase (AANH) superfamily ATPase
MLVHICCSVDSHYFLEQLKEDFPNEKIIGFFYDPNIHPFSEYYLRFLDVQRSCKSLGIELIEGEYNYDGWLKAVSGFEDEPEKGERCKICFDLRLTETVNLAKELFESKFTTTLLISPLKSQQRLLEIGKRLEHQTGIEFIFKDYRSKGGVEKQGKAVKKNNLYRQDYCGCQFALKKQRENQDRLADELFSPINNQVLPASIEERTDLYSNISETSELIKDSFLNYRLLFGKISIAKKTIPSYFLYYSHSEREKISGRIEKILDEVGFLNRNSVKIISLEKLNQLSNRSFQNIFEIKLSVPEEIEIRTKIDKTPFSLSPIIILDEIPSEKVEIEIKSKIYFDEKTILH